MGGLRELTGGRHPLIRDELNDMYWHVQWLTRGEK